MKTRNPTTPAPNTRTLRRRTRGRQPMQHGIERRTLRKLRGLPKLLAIAATGLLFLGCGGPEKTVETQPVAVMTPPSDMQAPKARTPVPTDSVAIEVDPLVQQADARLDRARAAIADARTVRADLFASADLREALTRLERAEVLRYDAEYLESIGQAQLSVHAAVKAQQEARAEYEAAQARSRRHEANRQLVLALTQTTRTDPRVTAEGIEVPVYGAFLPQDDSLSANGQARLEQLGAVARAHGDFKVEVTAAVPEAPSATDALNIGQSRAVKAGEYLQSQGVANERIVTSGELADNGRFLMVRFVPVNG